MNNNYTLGLVSVSFRNLAPVDIIKTAKNANLTAIEWGSDVHAPCNDRQKLEEIARLQKEYDISCSSYGTYFKLGVTPIEELEGYINSAKILGTNLLRIWCYNKNGNDMNKEERQNLLAESIKATEIAKKHGAVLCLECHKNSFTEKLEDALWLIETVNSENFKTYWQPFQWQLENENLIYAKGISKHTKHIHVFNWKDSLKLPLSLAITEWKDYLKNFSTPKTLLLEFMPNDKVEEVLTEANSLREIIENL